MVEFNEIINDSANETFVSVMESYLSILDKYDSLSEYQNDFIQENYFRPEDENGNPEKMIKTIVMAIPRLLIMIGNAIANVFRRLKGDPIKRLKDLDKKKPEELKELQDKAEASADELNNLTQKHLEECEKNVDDGLVENKNANESDDGYKKPEDDDSRNADDRRNLIQFEKKWMYSRIRFKSWKHFLDITEDYLDNIEFETRQKRPTTKLLATTRHRLNIEGPSLAARLNPFDNTPFFHLSFKNTLFYWIPRISTIGKYTKDAEEVMVTLKRLQEKVKDVSKRFKEVTKRYDEEKNERKPALKRLQKVCDEIMKLYKIINTLTNYLYDELIMWGRYIDIVEKAQEKKAEEKEKKKKQERKEEKERDKEARRVKVVHKEDTSSKDTDDDDDDDEDDEYYSSNVNEYASIYSRF